MSLNVSYVEHMLQYLHDPLLPGLSAISPSHLSASQLSLSVSPFHSLLLDVFLSFQSLETRSVFGRSGEMKSLSNLILVVRNIETIQNPLAADERLCFLIDIYTNIFSSHYQTKSGVSRLLPQQDGALRVMENK